MTVQTLAIAVVTVVYLVIRYLNRTDIPKIKGLPEIPGVPIFGNLLQLGNKHAVVAGKWAKKFGPVFQVRMGNRVSQGHLIVLQGKPETDNHSVLCLQIALIRCVSSGSRTSRPSFRDRLSTRFTALSLRPKASLSALPLGMSLANAVARLQQQP